VRSEWLPITTLDPDDYTSDSLTCERGDPQLLFMGSTDSEHSESSCLVLVIGSLQGGGAERQLSDMANYWARNGMRVTFATWMGPTVADFYSLDSRVRRVFLNVDIARTALFPHVRSNFQRVLKLRKLLSKTRPHAVLSFVTESNVLTILGSLGLGIRTVVSERVQPAVHLVLPGTWRALRRILYVWSDAVVAQTEEAAHWIQQNCRKKATVIPNALRSLPVASAERERLIIAVGRLTQQKGFDVLLRAFAKVASGFDSWRLVIIGEGDERGKLLLLRSELMLTDSAELLGQSADVATWMARAALVVQPSRFEGFPNVVLEAMGMGAAVISTDCPSGPAVLIEDGINGRLVPVDDVTALAQAMAELMSSQDVRKRLGLEASKVRERFRQDLIMAQWEECLLPLADRSQANARPE
jgi:GalNAc-alpha-(1->4)-GalNAc-alpha-(1->3)-diNAcBac-PP-undecaprenol alpha-1,4-N-acetyl-D-galactosaminyltransferase